MMADPYDDFYEYMAGAARWESFESLLRNRSEVPAEAEPYLTDLLVGCARHELILPRDSVYYRARIMPPTRQFDPDPLTCDEMGAPPFSDGGRLNSRGARCLYLASGARTATVETRPWRAARLTVAEFTTTRELRCVDLRKVVDEDTPTDPAHWFAFIMAKPVHRDDELRYVATQIVASRLTTRGYEGVLYPSALDPAGYNLAIFDCTAAQARRVSLREVLSVRCDDVVLGGGGRFDPDSDPDRTDPPYHGIAAALSHRQQTSRGNDV